ncbi:ATP-dependent Clp protease ATP-binding subunit ClpA-like protein, partial [Mucuna pruriens]
MEINLKDAHMEVKKIIGRDSGFVVVEIPFTPVQSLSMKRIFGTLNGLPKEVMWTQFGEESDYVVLLDNKLGQVEFHGGYVHNGLLKATDWVFDAEYEAFRELVEENPTHMLIFTGYSLGAGVVLAGKTLIFSGHNYIGSEHLLLGENQRILKRPLSMLVMAIGVKQKEIVNKIVEKFAEQSLSQGCKSWEESKEEKLG